MKKVFMFMLSFLAVIAFVACDQQSTVTTTTVTESTEQSTEESTTTSVTTTEEITTVPTTNEVITQTVIVEVEVEVEVEVDLTPSPDVEGLVYHWIPGSLDANVTATIDLLNADVDSTMVVFGNDVLEDYIDYEINGSTLTIFGSYLSEKELELGTHSFKVATNHGVTEFDVVAVDNPVDTTIETTTVLGIDMSEISNYTLAAPINGAPELLITEISTDMGMYEYIEVFNNTSIPYNLKNHRIVYANLERENMLDQGIFEEPYGMAGGVFIYQDYVIPALSTAIIWVVNAYPWEVGSADETGVRRVSESEGAEAKLFGTSLDNLSVDKFRGIYDLDSNVLVFPVRPQYMLMNGTYSNTGDGLGAPVAKSSSSRWGGVNSSIANRGVQIQKFDLDTHYSLDLLNGVLFGDAAYEIPVGATYFKYEVGVLNQEEAVYANGTLDKTVAIPYGKEGTQREGINIFYARMLFYNDSDEFVGYNTATQSIDCYNADKTAYMAMYNIAVSPVVSALVFPKLTTVEGVVTAEKWGAMHSMEYTIPVDGSTFMRFIIRDEVDAYTDFYANDSELLKTIKYSAFTNSVDEVLANKVLIIPVNSAYDTSYLSNGYNTIGKNGWFNFLETEPEN